MILQKASLCSPELRECQTHLEHRMQSLFPEHLSPELLTQMLMTLKRPMEIPARSQGNEIPGAVTSDTEQRRRGR